MKSPPNLKPGEVPVYWHDRLNRVVYTRFLNTANEIIVFIGMTPNCDGFIVTTLAPRHTI